MHHPVIDPVRPVAIIGAGVMGTKVAWACARSGLQTRLYDVENDKAQESIERALTWGSCDDRETVGRCLTVLDNLRKGLADVQLVFENVPEKQDLKRQCLAEVSACVNDSAYIGSNASSLLCSPLAAACRIPGRFFCMNFTDPRDQRLVELMGCALTDAATLEFAQSFARHIRMVPVPVHREQMGYAFNRLWRVIKKEVLRQIGEGYTSAEDIDRAWMLTFGTPYGPCGLMDIVGLHSVLNVERVYYQESGSEEDRPQPFLEDMVARGLLGEISGRGFYSYPEPAYRQRQFIEGEQQ